MTGLLGHVPAVFEVLVIQLSRLELASELARNRAHDGREHVGNPLVGGLLKGNILQPTRRAPHVNVCEEAGGLVFADVHPGQAHELTIVVPGVNHLGLDDQMLARRIRCHVQLGDIEPEVVEAANPLVHEVLALRVRD